jgi:predicted phosphodiesterase
VTRIGLISDIHGNLPALEAVLVELEHEDLDGLVCLGDVAVGPQPRETLARVRDLGCPVVLGNWDAWFLERTPTPIDQKLIDISGFWADQLDDDDRATLRTFAPTLEVELGDGEPALCFHGSPRSADELIYAATPDDEMDVALRPRRALMAGGHTHVQLVRRLPGTVFVNPGSVGLPFSSWWPREVRVARHAEYGILDRDGETLRIDLRRTSYDVDALLRLSLESGMPHAEWWAGTWDRPG